MCNELDADNTTQFISVDIAQFLGNGSASDAKTNMQVESSTNIIVLTQEERVLVDMVFSRLDAVSPKIMESLGAKISDLERLAKTIARFPSLFQPQIVSDEVRTPETLVQSLVASHYGDRLLFLPTKAILGKGFLVAKFHTFAAMTKTAHSSGFSKEEVARLRSVTLSLMFTLMAEDVYLSLLEDDDIPVDLRQQVAYALIVLWEHRCDQNIAGLAPMLDTIWAVRDKIAPAFGTMVGTSELLRLTIELDDQWREFIRTKLSDFDVSKSLEEFIFALSYEQINALKEKIRNHSVTAIGREEVYSSLGRDYMYFETEFDSRNFYQMYSVRRDNARARKRLNLEGPKKTLEDHFMIFLLEKKQEADS